MTAAQMARIVKAGYIYLEKENTISKNGLIDVGCRSMYAPWPK